MLHFVDWEIVIEVSEKRSASIFRVKLFDRKDSINTILTDVSNHLPFDTT